MPVPGGSGPYQVGEFYVTTPAISPQTFLQSVDAVSASTVAIQLQVGKLLVASTALIAVLQRQIAKIIAVTSAIAGVFQRQINKNLAVVVNMVVLAQKRFPRTIAAISAVGVVLQKQINKPLAATTAFTVTVVRGLVHLIALAVTSALAVGLAVLRVTPLASWFMPRPEDPWRRRPGD